MIYGIGSALSIFAATIYSLARISPEAGMSRQDRAVIALLQRL
jgi:hypothetical protein